ncbi:hypothetical protein JCM5350_004579 [Sporobolomyces pararoseus]
MRRTSNTVFQSQARAAPDTPLYSAQVQLPPRLSTTSSEQAPLASLSTEDRDQSQVPVSQPVERHPSTSCSTSRDLELHSTTSFNEKETRPMTSGTNTELDAKEVAGQTRTGQDRQRDEEEKEANQSKEEGGQIAQNVGSALRNAEMELKRALEHLMIQQVDRERTMIASQHRARWRKKWSLIVSPSSARDLEFGVPLSSMSGSSEFNSLAAQARLIASEFSLSSISGISIYLLLPQNLQHQPLSSINATQSLPTSTGPTTSSNKHVGRRVRLTESSWKVLWADHLEGSNEVQPVPGMNGLPVAGEIQFDVDSKRKRSRHHPTSQSRPASPSDSWTRTSRLSARRKTPSWTSYHSRESQISRESWTALDSEPLPSTFLPRPLSIVSRTSTIVGQSSPIDSRPSSRLETTVLSRPPSPSPSHSISQASISNPSTPSEPRSETVPTALDKSILASSTPSTFTGIDSIAFPLPPPPFAPQNPEARQKEMEEQKEVEDSIEMGGSSLDWTYELNRLKEISETSLFRDVASEDVSFDGSLIEGRVSDEVAAALHSFSTTTTSSLPTVSPLSLSFKIQHPSDKLSTDLMPVRYPFFSIYPSTYPHFDLYPSLLASPIPPPSFSDLHQPIFNHQEEEEANSKIYQQQATAEELSEQGLLSVEHEIAEEDEAQFLSNREGQNLVPESPTYVDPSVEWYRTATPQDRSPATSSYEEEDESEGLTDSEEEGEELFSHRYDGTMLTTIEEESFTRGFTAQMEEIGARLDEIREDVPTSDLEEEDNELDKDAQDDSFSILEPDSPNVPVIVRTRPSISGPSTSSYTSSPHRPVALELQQGSRSPSPLPSPTITPSSTVVPLEESPAAETTPSTESDQFEYELEYQAEGETDDLPYLSTPGLREALGFDDSPELQPFPFPADVSDIDSDDAREFPLEVDGTLEADDSCQTFDHLSPLPESPSSENLSTLDRSGKREHSSVEFADHLEGEAIEYSVTLDVEN